jgi:hypothetical protein
MAQLTLLDMVQDILSDMNSDNVNDISDTVESMQVARIVRSTYYNLVNDRIWPGAKRLATLTGLGDTTRPTHMLLPDNVNNVEWVKYDVRREVGDAINYKTITYMPPEDFLQHVMARNASEPNVLTVMDYGGTPLLIVTDRAPTYYTSFDDKRVVFDSYDIDVDSTLQTSKSQAFVLTEPPFELENGFIPDMPAKFFPYLLSEAKTAAFLKVKEVFSAADADTSRKQRNFLARNRHRSKRNRIGYANFGRKRP